MTFEDTLYRVLQTRRYDVLTGRTRNIRQIITDFMERVLNAILERIDFTLPHGSGDNSAIPLIFAVVGGALLAVGTVVLVRMFLHARKPRVYDLSELFEELKDRNYTVAGLLALSDEAADRRTAIRYRYIAALLALNEREIIVIRPSATNAIILREIKNTRPALAKPFTDMADTYHLAWYGYKKIDDTDFPLFCQAGDALIEAAYE